jgi:hypothetical protein
MGLASVDLRLWLLLATLFAAALTFRARRLGVRRRRRAERRPHPAWLAGRMLGRLAERRVQRKSGPAKVP